MQKYRKLNIFVAICFVAIFFRFYYFQIHEYLKYETKAGNNSLRKISIYAPRGIIYDRNNIPLVDNKQIYDLSIIPFDVTKQFDYDLITSKLQLSSDQLIESIESRKRSFNRFRPFTIKRHIDFQVRSKLEENKLDLPGTIFSEFPARAYPSKSRLTHVLGYLRVITEDINRESNKKLNYKSGDVFGYSGIEKMYESILRGQDGTEFRLVDIYGIDHGKYNQNSAIQSEPGTNINITIDSKLQSYIESLFINKKGAVICTNPMTGEVLAFVSAPDYDLNSFTGPVPFELWDSWNKDPEKPLLNRGIQGLYPPGSTFKLVSVALAIEKNIINKSWTVDCNGVYHFGDRGFHCWNKDGHGVVDLDKAIYQSCNIYFYYLMQKLSLEDWKMMAEDFGYGSPTGIDLYGEKSGIVPSRDYLNSKYGRYGWAAGNLLTFIIGQGDVLVTPIQVVQMMNIIAMNGQSRAPYFFKSDSSEILNVKLKQSTWDYIHSTLWNVVNHENGTGQAARVSGADVFGKTGTAQNPHGDDHSWFAGYMEKGSSPVLSLVVLVEHGGKGSVQAAIISNKIFQFFNENSSI